MLATMGVRPCVTANCLFEALVLEPHFCSILRPLLATLLPPWVADFAASILSLEDAKCEIASVQHLQAAYVQTVEQFAQRASETGEQSFAVETF